MRETFMQKKIITVFTLLLLLLMACSNPDTEQSGQNLTKKDIELDEVDAGHSYPLTGEAASAPVSNRMVGVMINNHPAARPQSGLSQADLVFEILAEGQTTRFLALFHSQTPEVVGPVRSARPYYFQLANSYNALYIYHGAANFIEDMLKAGAADHLNGAYYDDDGHLFKRESFRVAPHNSYLQFNSVAEVAAAQGYDIEASYEPLHFLAEDELDDIEGETVSEVELFYGQESVRYVYDVSSETYFRYNDQQQTVELSDQTPIQLNNVFIIETEHQIVDDAGRREVDLTSGGNAYLLQKGMIQKIQWENSDGRIVPVRNGEQVGLIPGQTWINVIPTDPGLSSVTEIE